jgi:hypothetical protein
METGFICQRSDVRLSHRFHKTIDWILREQGN